MNLPAAPRYERATSVTSLSSASASSTSFSESDMPFGGFLVYLVCNTARGVGGSGIRLSRSVGVRCGLSMSSFYHLKG